MKLTYLKPVAWVMLRELWATITLLLGVSLVAFLIIHSAPGDPFAQLVGESGAATGEIYKDLDLPTSWYGQYLMWLLHVLQGDLGTSLRTGNPVLGEVVSSGVNTLYLTIGALVVTLCMALPIAIYSSLHSRQKKSIALNIVAYVISAIPVFWLGYLAVYVSTTVFGYFPIGYGGTDNFDYIKFFLPILVLGFGSGLISEMTRHLRMEFTRTLHEEYMRTAKAKGASIWKHIFKEGLLIPTTEIIAIKMPFIIGGAVIIEQVFNWPGIGRMAWQAAQDRDFPVIIGIALAAAILVRIASLVHKLVFVSVNPRASHL